MSAKLEKLRHQVESMRKNYGGLTVDQSVAILQAEATIALAEEIRTSTMVAVDVATFTAARPEDEVLTEATTKRLRS